MSARARRSHHEEEHENHERWAVSYADMVTVLMCLFIVLFAISQVDQEKYIQLARGLADGFGTSSTTPLTGGQSLLDTTQGKPNPVGLPISAAPAPVRLNVNDAAADQRIAELQRQQAQSNLKEATEELDRLIGVQRSLEGALKKKGLNDRVQFRITERGLVAAVVSDDVFFASASATIQPKGHEVINAIAPVLAGLTESVSVEGHTNHLPIRGGIYPSNWELSAARAAAVVSELTEQHRIAPTRMIVTGYGETRPLYPRQDSRALTANRRVDVVVLDGKPLAVRQLIPQLAAARGIDTTGSTDLAGTDTTSTTTPGAQTPGTTQDASATTTKDGHD